MQNERHKSEERRMLSEQYIRLRRQTSIRRPQAMDVARPLNINSAGINQIFTSVPRAKNHLEASVNSDTNIKNQPFVSTNGNASLQLGEGHARSVDGPLNVEKYSDRSSAQTMTKIKPESNTATYLERISLRTIRIREYVLFAAKSSKKQLKIWLQLLKSRDRGFLLTLATFSIVAVLILGVILPWWESRWEAGAYALSSQDSAVIAKPNKAMAADMSQDTSSQTYSFNSKFNPMTDSSANDVEFGGAKIQASFAYDSNQGITVTDPYNQLSFTMTPKFQTLSAQKSQNQIVYPTYTGSGSLVYTAEAGGVKEDILLRHYAGNNLSFSYTLGLGSLYSARVLDDGSLAIYGSNLPLDGNVSTGSAKDAALLAKARAKAPKTKLLFTMPPPVIHETNDHQSSASATFSLKGDTLTVSANNLNRATYPLSIDPSVAVDSVTDFFRDTNDETNADFNAANNQINRGALTGGDIQSWAQTSNSMTQARGMAGSTIYNGYAYEVGGAGAGTISNYTGASYVEYGSISASTPSSVTWVNANSTGLPAGGLSRFKLIAYNGHLYAIDGSTTDTSCTSLSSNIYYTTIQVNGVLSNWQSISGPSTAVCSYGAAAYNGYLYVAGGKTGAANNTATTTFNYAQILPNGTLGTWNTTTALPTATYGGDLQAYNGYMYFIGGNQNGTLTNTVEYVPINSNGSLYTSWVTANSFTTARENLGANFSTVNDGYLYISGGCTALYSNQGCSTVAGDTQLAQINADGSLGQWSNNSTVPIIGSDVVQPVADSDSSGSAEAFPATANNTGSLNALQVYIDSGNTATTVYAGIYKNNAGVPQTLLASGSISSPTSSAWNTINLTGSASLTSGTQYWIAILGTGGTLHFRDGSTLSSSAETGLSSLPSTWSQSTTYGGSGPISAYATYNVSNVGGSNISSWNGAMYNIAGCTVMSSTSTAPQCTTALASQNYALYSSAGNVSALKTSSNSIPTSLFGASAAVLNGYIYVVGGCINNSCTGTGSVSDATSWAPISSNGSIGTWTNDTTNTINGTTGITETSLVAQNGTLYALGGYSGSGIVSTIWTETPSVTTGALSAAWASNTTALTSATYGSGALYFDGYIYTFGGCTSTTGFACSAYTGAVTKYSISGTTIGSGSTTSLTAIPTATVNDPNAFMGVAFDDGYVYLCGGSNSNSTSDGGPQTSKCVYDKLNSAGTITNSWAQTSGSLNQDITRGSAVAENGYLYVYGGYDGNDNSSGVGVISNDINVGLINSSTGNISSFSLSGTNVTARWGLTSVYNNGNVYTFGGCTIGSAPSSCSNRATTTEYFKIFNASNEGTRAITSSTNTVPTGEDGAAVVVNNGYIYDAGGCSNVTSLNTYTCHNGSFGSSNVYYAPINSDGSIGTWASANSLPAARSWGCIEAVNGNLYYMGGASTTSSNANVYKSVIGTSGTPGTWDNGVQTALPVALRGMGCTVFNNVIYVTGGYGSSAVATVYYSSINGSGNISAWNTATSFTNARLGQLAVVDAGYLFIIGGYTGSANLSDVQSIQLVASGGTSGSWSYTSDLPVAAWGMTGYAANGYIYVLGGANGTATTSCLNSTYIASVNTNGTLGNWSQGTATAFTALSNMGGGYQNGYYYAIGGYNCSSSAASSTAYYTGEQSQAIRSIFSRYIDLASDGSPEKFVALGTNAAIGGTDIDKWSLQYQSSRAATNAWGASQTINPITFGANPMSISALDASSTNQGVSEYWFLEFQIDQTQTFGFADSSQPAITRYDFYYAPGSSTRLRNGKTFQDQVQQSLDAHP